MSRQSTRATAVENRCRGVMSGAGSAAWGVRAKVGAAGGDEDEEEVGAEAGVTRAAAGAAAVDEAEGEDDPKVGDGLAERQRPIPVEAVSWQVSRACCRSADLNCMTPFLSTSVG